MTKVRVRVRNFVAKNAYQKAVRMKDRKRAAKMGDVKHKGKDHE